MTGDPETLALLATRASQSRVTPWKASIKTGTSNVYKVFFEGEKLALWSMAEGKREILSALQGLRRGFQLTLKCV